jgi:PAS domain S-box-containing protein
MQTSKVKDRLGKRERDLVAEIRTLKSRLARLERQQEPAFPDQPNINQSLRHSQERDRALLNAIPDTMYRFKRDGTIIDFKAIPENLLVPPDEVIGMNIMDAPVPDNVRQDVLDAVVKAIDTGELQEFECRLDMPDGLRIYENRYVRSGDDEAVAIVRDVTRRRRAEQQLRESDEKFRSTFADSSIPMALTDRDGRYVKVNRAMTKTFGYSEEELLTLKVSDLAYPGELAEETDTVQKLWSGDGEGIATEKRYVHRDGHAIWGHVTVSPVLDAGGQVRYLVGQMQDITQRKVTEEALRENETKFRTLFENMAQGAFFQFPDGRITEANQAALDILGLSLEQLQGRSSLDPRWCVVHEDGSDYPGEAHPSWVALNTGKAVRNVIAGIFNPQKEDYAWVSINVIPQFHEGKKEPYRVFVTLHDISMLKQAKEEFQAARDELKLIFDMNPDMICTGSPDGFFTRVNPAFAKVLGYSEQELLSIPYAQLIHPDDLEPTKREIEKQVKGQHTLNFINRYRHKCGSYRILEWQATPTENNVLYAAARDITDRVQAEERLAASEEKFRQIAETIREVFWVGSDDWKEIHYISPAYEEIWGRSCQSLYDRPLSWLEAVHEEDREGILAMIEEKSGDALRDPAFPEFRIVRPDGSVHWILARAYPVPDEKGRTGRVVGIAEEITKRKKATEDLQLSEKRFRGYFELGLIGMAVTSPEKNWMQFNKRLCDILGYSRKELSQMTWVELTHPDDLAADVAKFDRIMREEIDAYRMEKRFIRKDGRIVFVEISVRCVRQPNGQVDHFVAMVQDVTGRKQVEETLKTQQYYLEKAQEIGCIGTWELNLGENVLVWTDENYRIFGVPLGTALDYEIFLNCVHPEDRAYVHERWNAALNHEPYDIEHRLIVDGKTKWVREKADVEFDEQGNAVKAIGVTQDITAGKRAVQDLQEQHTIFNLLVEQTLAGYWDWRIPENTEYMSPTFKEMFGYEDHELANVPETWQTLIFPEDLPGVLELFQRHADSRGTVPFYNEVRYRHKDGSAIWVICTGQVIEWGQQDEPLRMIGCHVDITPRKRAEEALRRSETKFRALFEQAGGYCMILDPTPSDGVPVIVDANRAACLAHGYKREEFIGRPVADIDDEDGKRLVRERTIEIMTGKAFYVENTHVRKDGTSFPVAVNAKRIDMGGGPPLVLTTEYDISDRKQAEDALKKSEEKYRRFYEDAPLGYQSLDASGNFLDVNGEWLRVLGYSKEEVLGRFFGDFVAPECLETFSNNFPRFKAGGATRGTEFDMVRKDGSRVTVAFDGNVEYDQEGHFKRTHCIMHDISERKKAERELLENQSQLKSLASELVLAEEQERKRLAVHLHDDVCQNLAYAKMKLQMLGAALEDETQLDDMTEVGDTLTRLMREVRTLTFELSTPVLTEFGLATAISHWLDEQIQGKHDITVAFVDDGQPKPLGEDVQALLFRSVRELLANVVKHSQAQCVTVSMGLEEDQILVCLEDNGIGFAPDEVVVGKATGGFGLFSIRERLSHMGGSLEIDSSPGQGCRSVLKAPLAQS